MSAKDLLADMRRKYLHALEKANDPDWLAGEPITAQLLENWIPQVEELDRQLTEDMHGCPCINGQPCSDRCSCIMPFSSTGCGHCCRYGSEEQRKFAAERIVSALKAKYG